MNENAKTALMAFRRDDVVSLIAVDAGGTPRLAERLTLAAYEQRFGEKPPPPDRWVDAPTPRPSPTDREMAAAFRKALANHPGEAPEDPLSRVVDETSGFLRRLGYSKAADVLDAGG